MVNSPFVDGIEVAARVQRTEVGPEVALLVTVLGVLAEREDANVGRAHEVDADGLDAVVWQVMYSLADADFIVGGGLQVP